MHPAVAERLSRLAPDQRAAATAPPGPVLCVAPAGSGKTTTLVARIAWLVDGGVMPEAICALTFNRRAAEELRARMAPALLPLGDDLGDRVRIRTFHALGLEILREAGKRIEPLLDRDEIIRAVRTDADRAERNRLDGLLSRFKLDLRVDPADIEADLDAGPVARTFAAYEAEIRRRGGLDFDDLVARALTLLEREPAVLGAWRKRCAHLLVDEAQDLDRSQLTLALLLAAPANRIFLVGDDDQSIYGWRLADVRRLLGLASEALPGLARVDLVTNYRCPEPVLARSVRLIEHNVERFGKVIRARPNAEGRLILARSAADDVERIVSVVRSWPQGGDVEVDGTRAILARTNRELLPAVAGALRLEIAFQASRLELPIESALVDELLATASGLDATFDSGPTDGARARALMLLGHVRDRAIVDGASAAADEVDAGTLDRAAIAAALLGWAAGMDGLAALADAIAEVRRRLELLRTDDAALTLATAHGTKGLEFDHVAVIGLDEGRFPSARSVAEAVEPARALEEERRLAYVAWTRARRSLTLVYDPGSPSPFLLEAFTRTELGVDPSVG